MLLITTLSTRDLRSLNGAHLVDPSRAWCDLTDGSNLITSVTWNTNIVTALKSELNITDLQNFGATFLGILTCGLKDLIDEVIGDCKDGLVDRVSLHELQPVRRHGGSYVCDGVIRTSLKINVMEIQGKSHTSSTSAVRPPPAIFSPPPVTCLTSSSNFFLLKTRSPSPSRT